MGITNIWTAPPETPQKIRFVKYFLKKHFHEIAKDKVREIFFEKAFLWTKFYSTKLYLLLLSVKIM